MNFISEVLKFIGLGWVILAVTIGVLGGNVAVRIINPITKKIETITAIEINKNI